MKVLILAATEMEIAPALALPAHKTKNFEFLITGVGMVATTYALTRRLQETKYDLIVNVGIAGAFDKQIELGSLFRVKEDVFSELGAQDDRDFLSISYLGLGCNTFTENAKSAVLNQLRCMKPLIEASAITVNTVHGQQDSIAGVRARLDPTLESMEGAAVFYVAGKESVPVLQIRSASNYVERRNKENWDIPLAVKQLSAWLLLFIEELSETTQL